MTILQSPLSDDSVRWSPPPCCESSSPEGPVMSLIRSPGVCYFMCVYHCMILHVSIRTINSGVYSEFYVTRICTANCAMYYFHVHVIVFFLSMSDDSYSQLMSSFLIVPTLSCHRISSQHLISSYLIISSLIPSHPIPPSHPISSHLISSAVPLKVE